jgi:UDP-N-acetylmuramoyl-tripeptide--D-alanyl-D-alanine ligase
MRLDLNFAIDSMDGILLAEQDASWIEGISTDSRKVKPGELFFALQGENFDGHDYIKEVLEAGATAVVVSSLGWTPPRAPLGSIILVEDTLVALQKLAGRYRQLFSIPVVAVTGSVGKTTTKDMLADCLAPVFKTLKTQGNYNNEIGLPLTLMNMDKQHSAAVVELAMRSIGEITYLARILQPTFAIITNVERVHLETMGSLENIARAKCEVLEFIAKDKFALINGDNELLTETAKAYQCTKYSFGYGNSCDIQVLGTELAGAGIDVSLRLLNVREHFYLPVPANHLAANLAAAVGTAYLMGVSPEKIRQGLELYQSSGNRLRIIDLAEGGVFIDDTYNANPISMMAALEVCKDVSAGRKTLAVLGDMLELGNFEIDGHTAVGQKVAELGLDMLVTIGQRAAYIGQGAVSKGMPVERIKHFQSREGCLPWLKQNLSKQETVLFKGSRGMQLDKLVEECLD